MSTAATAPRGSRSRAHHGGGTPRAAEPGATGRQSLCICPAGCTTQRWPGRWTGPGRAGGVQWCFQRCFFTGFQWSSPFSGQVFVQRHGGLFLRWTFTIGIATLSGAIQTNLGKCPVPWWTSPWNGTFLCHAATLAYHASMFQSLVRNIVINIYIFTYAIVQDVFAPMILQQSLINSIELYHQLHHHCLQSIVYHVIPS